MRHLFFSAIFICISLHALADNVRIHGKIKNPLSTKITFSYNLNYVSYDPKEYAAELDDSGRFEISLPVKDNYQLVMIEHGDQATELVVKNGYDLTMTLDGKDFDKSLKYSGKGSDVANFAAKHVLLDEMTPNYGRKLQPLFIKDPQSFSAAIQGEQKKQTEFLTKNGAKLPADFKKFWLANYQYNNYMVMLQYPTLHEIMKKQSYDIGTVPPENYSEVAKMPARFDDAYLSLDAYRNYLSQYYAEQYEIKGVKDADGDDGKIYNQSDSAIKASLANMPPKSAEAFLAEKIFMGIKYTPLERTETLYKKFQEQYPQSEYDKLLKDRIELKKKLMPGKPALDFAITLREGRVTKLSELKGKVVLLDFWASWCGPCMSEMPYSQKVQDHFKDRDVVFVFVSIDEDANNWVRAIETKHLKGLHMRDNGWKGLVPKMYGIEGVPSYFLIDKDGNFAMENVPRPSQTNELIGAIEELLSKK